MTTFQIISIVMSGLVLLIAILGVYVKAQVQIKELEMRIKAIEKDLLQKEIASLLAEKINREDHKIIMDKIDKLMDLIIKR